MNTLKAGVLLYTRDGRKIGNANITTVIKGTNPKNISEQITYYRILTDYGNTATFSLSEIKELFHDTET